MFSQNHFSFVELFGSVLNSESRSINEKQQKTFSLKLFALEKKMNENVYMFQCENKELLCRLSSAKNNIILISTRYKSLKGWD